MDQTDELAASLLIVRQTAKENQPMQRASGVLLHPTALPGPFRIGDLGEEAFLFVDFLVKAGQSLWQILPLGPTGYGHSPYNALSAFAGNPALINLQQLVVKPI